MVKRLEIDAEQALFTGAVQGLAVACYAHERPQQGLAGLLDWRFHGALSRCLRAGAITGSLGECAYLPITRNQTTYHLICVGAGHGQQPGLRTRLPNEAVAALKKNLATLRLTKIGVSSSDFGGMDEEYFAKTFSGVPLWIAP